MSFEEDYLLAKVKELDARLAKVEKRTKPNLWSGGFIEPVQDEPKAVPQDGPQDEDEYEKWPFAALRTEAKERGLSGAGTAAELAARLREDDQESP